MTLNIKESLILLLISAPILGGITYLDHGSEKKKAIIAKKTQITHASYQDVNLDGTNELIVADASGRTTTLWRYNDLEAGISNQYFSIEEIRRMREKENVRNLEQEMKNYQESLDLYSRQGGER